jgi:hypothetical protein
MAKGIGYSTFSTFPLFLATFFMQNRNLAITKYLSIGSIFFFNTYKKKDGSDGSNG